jgi:hypothetical protein
VYNACMSRPLWCKLFQVLTSAVISHMAMLAQTNEYDYDSEEDSLWTVTGPCFVFTVGHPVKRCASQPFIHLK